MGEQRAPDLEKEGLLNVLLITKLWEIAIEDDRTRRTLTMREGLLSFLKWIFGLSLVVTLPAFLAALFLTGWKTKTGFEISDKLLMFLGGATVGEIAGLISTAIVTFLKMPEGRNPSPKDTEREHRQGPT